MATEKNHLPYDAQDYDDESNYDVMCKYCSKQSLTWEMTPDGWRLFEGDEPHVCDNPQALAKGMEKLNSVSALRIALLKRMPT